MRNGANPKSSYSSLLNKLRIFEGTAWNGDLLNITSIILLQVRDRIWQIKALEQDDHQVKKIGTNLFKKVMKGGSNPPQT